MSGAASRSRWFLAVLALAGPGAVAAEPATDAPATVLAQGAASAPSEGSGSAPEGSGAADPAGESAGAAEGFEFDGSEIDFFGPEEDPNLVPAYVPEMALVPRRDRDEVALPDAEGDPHWAPEAALQTGYFAHDDLPRGLAVGGRFAVLERGAQTRGGFARFGESVRTRRVWGPLALSLGFALRDGLDELRLDAGVFGRRTEATSATAVATRTVTFAPVTLARTRPLDRDLDLDVAAVCAMTTRTYAISRGRVDVIAEAEAPGIRFIDYAGDHHLTGARLVGLAAEVIPVFEVSGGGGLDLVYILGGAGDVTIGARDGGLFASHSSFASHTGFGVAVADRVTWRSTLGYRAAVDTRRDLRSGWVVRSDVSVALP